MKVLMMFAASAVSAIFVLPTISQAQSASLHQPGAEMAADAYSSKRQA